MMRKRNIIATHVRINIKRQMIGKRQTDYYVKGRDVLMRSWNIKLTMLFLENVLEILYYQTQRSIFRCGFYIKKGLCHIQDHIQNNQLKLFKYLISLMQENKNYQKIKMAMNQKVMLLNNVIIG